MDSNSIPLAIFSNTTLAIKNFNYDKNSLSIF